jgi:hypothetical protein
VAKKTKTFGAIFLALGILSNAIAILANRRTMPVVGMPAHFRPASAIWQSANAHSRLLPLADHASISFFSIGDLFLLAGALVLIVRFVQINSSEGEK